MSSFFDSEIIQKELEEIQNLQQQLYGTILTFGYMTKEEKVENIEKMSQLLEKQRVMYTRLSLSDDPQAVELKENLKKSIAIMGFPPDTDMSILFSSMTKTIETLKNNLD